MKPIRLFALFCVFLIAADKPKDTSSTDRQKLQGAWQIVQELHGDNDTSDEGKLCQLIFDGNKFIVKKEQKAILEGTFTLDASKSPPQLDLLVLKDEENQRMDQTGLGIYRLDGDKFKLCISEPGRTERPTEFVTKGTDLAMFTMERVKK